jgi:Carbonic anhydrases/acetyltransferases, isoleucine patch superfamily
MKNLLIIGTGGFAREVYFHAHNSLGYGTKFLVKGFLEGNTPLKQGQYDLLPKAVLNNVLDYAVVQDDVFVIAIANSTVKEEIAKIIGSKGGKFINLIHNTAVVSPNAELGIGVILCPFVFISCDTCVGDHVMFNVFSDLGHDSIVGDYTSVMCHVDITGNCKVEDHTFWGSGARALPGSKIGNYAKIGAGSVVLKKVHAGETVFGVPAMPI